MILQEDFGLVLAAAGLGSRFGSDVPKQFWELRGKPLYLHALEPFLEVVAEAVLVVPSDWIGKASAQVRALFLPTPIRFQEGGATRQESVSAGLQGLTSSCRFVLVHDAVRPYVSPGLIESVVNGTKKHGSSIPVVPVRDTVKVVEREVVVRTIDRRPLCLTQTPQGFELRLLQRALNVAAREGIQGTDEASLVENLGETVHVVEGDTGNTKVTWPEDLSSV
jgi:2-C-methyl-D-erythritol 4-phosphate cytidylyltransferase